MPDSLARPLQNSPQALIDRALDRSKRPVLSTKFGPESAVLLHMVVQRCPGIPVIWVDTGYNTRATRLFAARLQDRLQLNLQVYSPRGSEWVEVPDLDDPCHAEFTRRVKLEPFDRALSEQDPDVWFTALRRAQTDHRRAHPAVRQTARGYLKVAPLLDWSDRDMSDYLQQHDLPRGPECYDPTKGDARRECGLHLVY